MRELPVSRAGADRAIAIVVAEFNPQVGEGLLAACTEGLTRQGVPEDHILVARVPGALEIPLALQKLAQSGRYDALIALGCVVRGETYHFELVANQSAAGITQVQLDFGIPIANGVLTTENDAQALARMAQKGLDCALAALQMVNLDAALKSQHA